MTAVPVHLTKRTPVAAAVDISDDADAVLTLCGVPVDSRSWKSTATPALALAELAAAVRGLRARIHITVAYPDADGALPAGPQCSYLVAAGIRRVEFAQPLGEDCDAWCRFVAFARDAVSRGLEVGWTASAIADPELYNHLDAPDSSRTEQPAGCWWRQGPGYLLVIDRRFPGTDTYRLRAGHEQTFKDLMTPTRVVELSDTQVGALGALEQVRLVVQAGGWAVTLPYHVTRWPVPAHGG